MNTPKFLITLFFSIFLFSACSDDDDNSINSNSLPNTATAFIEQNLPGYKILKVEDLKPKEGDINKYKVSLDKDLIVVFTEMGLCVEAENETKLPESLINFLLVDEIEALKAKYPTLEVKQIFNNYWDDNFYKDAVNYKKVILADNTEVRLYSYLGINKTNVGVAVKDLDTEPLAQIKEFMNKYYDSDIQIGLLLHAVESDGREVYKAYLTGSGSLQARTSEPPVKFAGLIVFDSDGVWQNIYQSEMYPISDRIFQTLTDYAKERFVSMYPDKYFYEISKVEDHYIIRVSNNFSTTIPYKADPAFQMNVVMDFISTHFGSTITNRKYTVKKEQSGSTAVYSTTVVLEESKPLVVKMESLVDGIWFSLETEYGFIPGSIIQILPSEIVNQLKKENLLEVVNKITRSADGSSFVVQAGSKEFVYPQAS